jgi:hypothetical protein
VTKRKTWTARHRFDPSYTDRPFNNRRSLVDAADEPQEPDAAVGTGKSKKRAKKDAKRVNEARKRTLDALETLEGVLRTTAKEIKVARKLLTKA